MEKIMNLQMPGSMSSGSGSRSVQRGDLGEGFLKMMQQKQETSGSDSKTEKAETPVKDAQSKPKEEPEEVPAEDQEPTDELDLLAQDLLAQELAAQQVAVQQTVVTPDWQEQPVQTEPVVEAAALELTAELPAEEPKMPVAGDMDVQQMPEHADAKPAEDLPPSRRCRRRNRRKRAGKCPCQNRWQELRQRRPHRRRRSRRTYQNLFTRKYPGNRRTIRRKFTVRKPISSRSLSGAVPSGRQSRRKGRI